MSEKLKPCPFCGGEAKTIERQTNGSIYTAVNCKDLHCPAFGSLLHNQPLIISVAYWNRRHTGKVE